MLHVRPFAVLRARCVRFVAAAAVYLGLHHSGKALLHLSGPQLRKLKIPVMRGGDEREIFPTVAEKLVNFVRKQGDGLLKTLQGREKTQAVRQGASDKGLVDKVRCFFGKN
jgi:hypothetical protein